MNAAFQIAPGQSGAGRLSMAVFDQIEHGLIVCNEQGQVLLANHAGRDELAAGRLICMNGKCLQRAAFAAGALEMALRQAATRQRRALIRLTTSNDHLLISLVPLVQDRGTPGEVLLMLGRRTLCSELGLEMLASNYGLTLAERRVLASLVRECTPREIAALNAVALSTVRTQIAAIRAKLGARNVEALLLRAAQLPPVASALRGAGAGCGWVAQAV